MKFDVDNTYLVSLASLIWIEVTKVFASLSPVIGLLIQTLIGVLTALYLVAKIRYIRKLNNTTFPNEKPEQNSPGGIEQADRPEKI